MQLTTRRKPRLWNAFDGHSVRSEDSAFYTADDRSIAVYDNTTRSEGSAFYTADDRSIAVYGNTTRGENSTLSTADNSSSVALEGLVSLSTTILIVDVLSCGVQPIISLSGLLGNTLSLVVLLYQGIRRTTNIILIGLTVTDLVYVLVSIRSQVECLARPFDPQLAVQVFLLSHTSLIYLETELAVLSRLYVCFVAVERLIVVQFPLKASRLLTRRTVFAVSGCLWIWAALSCMHCFFSLQVQQKRDPASNATVQAITPTTFYRTNYLLISLYSYIIGPIINRYVSTVLVCICTFRILQILRSSRDQRMRMSRSVASADEQQQQQITKALIGICVVFLLTNIPWQAVFMLKYIYASQGFRTTGRYKNVHRIAISISHLFMLFNSSINFSLYVIFNQRFVAILRQLLRMGTKPSKR